MYGGSSKPGGGRGGRGGVVPVNKRASFPPPPPPHRPASRLSLGGGSGGGAPSSNPRNNRPGPTPTPGSSTSAGVEETFSIISGRNSRAYGIIVKLAPGLVEELKKLEALGGTPRIKFDSQGNPTGNVIDVGGKEFKFTWSPEIADLCDIYEEHQSGEDGNGSLVESGSCCRKVNVQRILDESTTNHVKMRSEEAERKLKSRKAIVLDHGNPSMKHQLKQMAAAESNPWKMFKQKKGSPFKKQKVEAPQAAGPPKSTFKSGSASTVAKVTKSSSPLPSPPEQSGVPASTFGTGSITKIHPSTEVIVAAQAKSKENAANSEKEIPTKSAPVVRETLGHKESPTGQKGNLGVKQMDLRNMLITLLKENPKGMNLKALEKAVGNAFPNSANKIEPTLKKIAILQGPGRYFLKPGLGLESIKKLSSESGSSPEDNYQHALTPKDSHYQGAPGTKLEEKNLAVESEDQAQSNSKFVEELNALGKNDIRQQSPDQFGDKKVSNHGEGPAGSSSESGSDSDSESESSDSDSDSGSRSRSRSRSPAGSGSGSSSESDSDASSNSKEGPDEEVDIMTSDDDKEPQQDVQVSEPAFPGSPETWRSAHNAMDEKQDGDEFTAVNIEDHVYNAVEIDVQESDAFDADKGLIDDEREIYTVQNESLAHSKESEGPVDAAGHDIMQDRETFMGKLFGSSENLPGESFRHELPNNSEMKSKGKSKRGPDDEKPEHTKRAKTESSVPGHGSRGGQLSESPHYRQINNNYKGSAIQVNKADRDDNAAFNSQKGYNQTISRKPNSDLQQSGQRSSDQNTHSKASDKSGRSKHTESSGRGRKSSEKASQMHEGLPLQKGKSSTNGHVNNFAMDKKIPRNAKETGVGGRNSVPSDSQNRKQGEIVGKPNDAVPVDSHAGSSPTDANRFDMEKLPVYSGKMLQRELSDLEQGELREPLEETPVKKQFERKGSFKNLENKTSTSDNFNSDSSKGKPVGKAVSDSGKPSPPNLSAEYKNAGEHSDKSLSRSRNKVALSLSQSRGDNVEVGSQFNKPTDSSGRLRQNDVGIKVGSGTGVQGEGHNKALVSAQQQHDSKRGLLSHSTKESKTQPSNKISELIDGQRDTLSEGNNSAPRKRESSSEEDSASYAKYEKDVPELKGPIKDFSQYEEYVQEYREKYDGYCTLNKILESYRNEFQKLEKDLESAKGRSTYHKILEQLKESYCQCGPRHQRLKKIFVVLHEELKNLKQRIKDFAVLYTKN